MGRVGRFVLLGLKRLRRLRSHSRKAARDLRRNQQRLWTRALKWSRKRFRGARKRGRSLGRSVQRRWRDGRRVVASVFVTARRRLEGAADRLADWNPAYRAPSENGACPACASAAIRHLDTLPLTGHSGKRVGFISGCDDCGLAFANPRPSPEDLERLYAPEGKFDAERYGMAQERARSSGIAPSKLSLIFGGLRDELDVLTPPRGAKVLDFGCGDGGFLNSLQDLGWDTFGIEPSTAVAFARHQELTQLPEDPTFDLAIVHHVLEHLGGPLPVLDSIARSTKEGGIVFISVPRLDALARHDDRDYCIRSSGHIVAYTEDCLRALLARCGLETVSALTDPWFDERLTQGRPVRLRMLARRVPGPVSAPTRPLRMAVLALGAHRRAHRAELPWAERFAPVRLRASLEDARRARALEERRHRGPGRR